MDLATRLALRAIVSGLQYSGTIDQRHVSKIVEALAEADGDWSTRISIPDRVALRTLCMDIARDGQVACPIEHPEPPMDWNH